MTVHLKAGRADQTLKDFAKQARRSIVFEPESVEGVQTNAVDGIQTPREALVAMLAGTPLVFDEELGDGAFAIRQLPGTESPLHTNPELSEKEMEDPKQKTPNRNPSAVTPSTVGRWLLKLVTAGLLTAVSVNGQEQKEAVISDEIIQLDPYSVSASQSDGYSAATATATKMNTLVRDIPQTINVVTAELLEDSGAFSTRDAFNYVSNMTPRTNTHQPGIFFVRGMQLDLNYVDGFIQPSLLELDMAPFARVEVIKGPASAIVGRGEPAGIINYVRKKPSTQQMVRTKLQVGDQGFYRGDLDATGPLGKSDSLSYRFVGFVHRFDGEWEGSSIKRYGIYPSVEWVVAPKTRILFQGEFIDGESPANIGYEHMWNSSVLKWRVLNTAAGINPPFPVLPRSFNMDGPGSIRDTNVKGLNAIVRHEFSDWAGLAVGVSASNSLLTSSRYQGVPSQFYDAATDTLYQNRVFRGEHNDRDDLRAQGNLVLTYGFPDALEGLNARNTTLFGFEWADTSTFTKASTGNLARVNLTQVIQNGIGAAIYDQTITGFAENPIDNEFDGLGLFFSHETSFWNGRLGLTFGMRYDEADSFRRIRNTGSETTFEPESTTAPRWGATVKPVDWMTLYYVHSEQEDPSFERVKYTGLPADDPRGNIYIQGQRRGVLNEFGVKGEFLDGKVNFTAAYFDVKREGQVFTVDIKTFEPGFDFTGLPNSDDPFAYRLNLLATGEVVTGWEFELYGEPIEHLTLIANLAVTEGQSPLGSPDNLADLPLSDWQGSIFGKYSFRGADGNGFTVRAGYRIYGPRVLTFGAPAAAKIDRTQDNTDVGISYTWGRHVFDLAVNNLADTVIIYAPNSHSPTRSVRFSWSTVW